VAVSAPVDCEPLVAFVPDQPPDATHELASVEDQLSVEAPPLVTLVGLAVSITVGAAGDDAVTVTIAEAVALPPPPLQLRVNVLLAAVSAPVLAEPAVARLPVHAPEAVQLVAFAEDQVSELLPPLATLVGLAAIFTVGAGVDDVLTVTIAEAVALPPAPLQLRVNVLLAAVSGPVDALPCVAFLPDQAPSALHLEAPVVDQLRVAELPFTTLCGLAVKLMVSCELDALSAALLQPNDSRPAISRIVGRIDSAIVLRDI